MKDSSEYAKTQNNFAEQQQPAFMRKESEYSLGSSPSKQKLTVNKLKQEVRRAKAYISKLDQNVQKIELRQSLRSGNLFSDTASEQLTELESTTDGPDDLLQEIMR